ncbi:hypothetical protein GCM10010483_03570 [Actinokineospora diospyrosa]
MSIRELSAPLSSAGLDPTEWHRVAPETKRAGHAKWAVGVRLARLAYLEPDLYRASVKARPGLPWRRVVVR